MGRAAGVWIGFVTGFTTKCTKATKKGFTAEAGLGKRVYHEVHEEHEEGVHRGGAETRRGA